jgi:hypothetical protein
MIIGVNNKPKLINYYGVISPITYLLYLLSDLMHFLKELMFILRW